MYSYDWNFSISFILLYFPIAEALNLCVKSYFLVITVHQKYPPQWIFLCSGIAERIEILVIILPKLFVSYFYLARFVNPMSSIPLAALVLPLVDVVLILRRALESKKVIKVLKILEPSIRWKHF